MVGYGPTMSQRIIERAWRAYLVSDGLGAERPNSCSSIEIIDGLKYVVLRNGRAVLAVYRLTNRGKLRRMKRWPLALNTMGREATRERTASRQIDAAP